MQRASSSKQAGQQASWAACTHLDEDVLADGQPQVVRRAGQAEAVAARVVVDVLVRVRVRGRVRVRVRGRVRVRVRVRGRVRVWGYS